MAQPQVAEPKFPETVAVIRLKPWYGVTAELATHSSARRTGLKHFTNRAVSSDCDLEW